MGHFSFKFVSLIIMLFLILQTEVVLKFWANGFSVDDGPLRAIDDPANEQFLGFCKKRVGLIQEALIVLTLKAFIELVTCM